MKKDKKTAILWVAAWTFDIVMLISCFTMTAAALSQAWFMFAATLALGLFQSAQQYQAQKNQAEAIEAQAEIDQDMAARERAENARIEQERVNTLRDKQRRNRAMMEAAYAKSGVILDGSAADILTKQRGADERNVQKQHTTGNYQRALNKWGADQSYKQSMYSADSIKSAADTNLGVNILSTGMGAAGAYNQFGINGKGAGSLTGSGTKSVTNANKPQNGMFSWFKF